MPNNISTNKEASSPPTPACISIMALALETGGLSINSILFIKLSFSVSFSFISIEANSISSESVINFKSSISFCISLYFWNKGI